MNTFAGLNAGILCSGMMMVVFLEMLRAVFTVNQGVFHDFHKFLNGLENVCAVNTCSLGDFANDVCLCHGNTVIFI